MFIRPTSFQSLVSDDIAYSGIKFVPADDGSVDVSMTSDPPAPLPTYDTLQLDNMLAAGVPLEKVNPHILGTSSMSEFEASKKIFNIVENQSGNPDPVEPAPVEPAPVEPTPVEPAPAQ